MQTLASLADKNRVLLVFAPSARDPRVSQQIKLLSHHSAERKERDLVLLPIFLDPTTPPDADTLRDLNPQPVPDVEQLTLRSRFHIAQKDFAVVLIGKDGGEKFRAATPVTLERLDHIIDAMPMRQNEIKRKPPA